MHMHPYCSMMLAAHLTTFAALTAATEMLIAERGTAASELLRERGGAGKLLKEAACDLTWRDFDSLYDSIAFFDQVAADYFSATGTRLGGSHSMSFPYHMRRSGGSRHVASADGRLSVGECTASTPHGTWHTQRIGPLRSFGGYDWFNIYHRDFATVKQVMSSLSAGQRVGVTAHVTGPVDERGKLLPLPPIHIHHNVIAVGSGGVHAGVEVAMVFECLLRGESCLDASGMVCHLGDYQCLSDGGGTDCFAREYGEHIKLFTEPLALTAMLNDVRPAGSPPLVWYYQAALRVTIVNDPSALLPLSAQIFAGPFEVSVQFQNFGTIDVPAGVDSLVYYSGRIAFGGTIMGIDWHSHQLKFQSALVVASPPDAMGLGAGKLRPRRPWLPIITTEAGFGSNTALREYLLHQLALSSGSLDALVCDVHGRTEVANGTRVDRLPSKRCQAWTFSAEDVFTVAGFCGPITQERTDGPVFAGMSGTSSGSTFSQHVQAIIYYVAADAASHYTIKVCSQDADATDRALSRRDVLRAVFHGGTADAPPTPLEHAAVAFLVFYLYCADAAVRRPLAFLALVASLIYGLHRLKRKKPHLCSCRMISLAVTATVYVGTLVVSTFLVQDLVFLVNRVDAELLASMEAEYATATTRAILVAVGVVLVASVTASCVMAAAATSPAKAGGSVLL